MSDVTLTIDGRQVTARKGTSVLQAAIEAGIQVPYYCYHPGLGVDASCRVCLVKIEKMPKLQTSCSTTVADGMVVQTQDLESIEGRAGVFEFLLINHPLDCPVCDKGGECPLQDFSYTFGNTQSRMDFPRRTFDGEGVKADVGFGPTLMLNRNRCILCTRCVRFMREVDGDAQIGIVDRGNGSEIATFNEQGVHSLLSGNLVDVCPVGAITARQYRFRSRPWDNPQAVDTTCTLCAKGCSTTAWIKAKPEWAKGSRLIRMTPRYNPDVNGFWMCDIGRYGWEWVEGDTRLRKPRVAGKGAGVPSSWQDALAAVRDRLDTAGRRDPASVQFLVSAHASLEELFLVRKLAETLKGESGRADVHVAWRESAKPQPENTKFPIPATDAPNVLGARALSLTSAQSAGDAATLRAAVDAGRVTALYVIDPGPDGSLGDTSWLVDARGAGRLETLVYQGVLDTALARAADVVLPAAAWVEKDTLYVNEQGRVQAASKVLAPPGEAVEDWQILTSVATALGLPFAYTSSEQVRTEVPSALSPLTDVAPSPAEPTALAGGPPAGPGLGPLADLSGIAFNRPVSAKHWLQSSNPVERFKWNEMFQDLPPVKGHNVQMESAHRPAVIPLTPVSADASRSPDV